MDNNEIKKFQLNQGIEAKELTNLVQQGVTSDIKIENIPNDCDLIKSSCFSCKISDKLLNCVKCSKENCDNCLLGGKCKKCVINEINKNKSFLNLKRQSSNSNELCEKKTQNKRSNKVIKLGKIRLIRKSRRENINIKCSACGDLRNMNNIKYCSTLNCKEPYCFSCIKSNKVIFLYNYNNLFSIIN